MNPKNYKLIIAQLISISLLIALSIDIYLPSLPNIEISLHASHQQADLSMGIFIFGFAIGQLFCGPLSDSLGRKSVLLCGLVIFSISSLICFASPNISILLIARFFQAIGACVGPITAFAMVKDLFQKHEIARIITYITTAMTVSPMIAPFIGSFLQALFSWRSNFLFLVIFVIILMTILVKNLPETVLKTDKRVNFRQIMRHYISILANLRYWTFIISLTCASAMLFSFFTNSPFLFINQLGLSGQQFSILFASNAFALIFGGLLAGHLTKKFPIEKVIGIGGTIAFVGALSMLWLAKILPISILTILVPMLICSIGIATIIPVSIAGAISDFPTCTGSASAMANFLRYSGAFLVIFLLSYFKNEKQLFLAITLLICSSLVLIVYLLQKICFIIVDPAFKPSQ